MQSTVQHATACLDSALDSTAKPSLVYSAEEQCGFSQELTPRNNYLHQLAISKQSKPMRQKVTHAYTFMPAMMGICNACTGKHTNGKASSASQ